ncbi:hypothetical protein RDV89_11825 [Nocardioides zeae]|uniref:Bacteriocin biosynthesis cyclodehydratase domain-containing protein n=1 Tax=Nocardioides imazamoxiresistens TaxID=3231893 RepID=A0ABU3PYB4_9ACTN|nr:hypothetical protein [Nocardioides zeae]MDT9593760.1 hypothetical protein [Nocardioides zeae]
MTTGGPGPSRRTRPERPVLRPGVPTLRRGDGHLQVGLEVGARAVVPDTPDVRELLTALRTGDDLGALLGAPSTWPAEVNGALDLLVRTDLVVAADTLLTTLAQAHRVGADPGTVAALFAADPDGVPARWSRRRDSPWAVDGPAPWAARLVDLLTAAGVPATEGAPEDPATPRVLLAVGEPDRGRADGPVRDGTPHLWVALLPDRVRVGPLVEPGRSACLRCRDATLAESDPRLPLALALAVGDPGGLAPPPVDRAGAELALSLATREVLAHVDGDDPATLSATVEIGGLAGPDAAPRARSWPRHAWCGCGWDELASPA